MISRNKKILAFAGVGVVAATLLIATPALAEGSWSSSLSGARPGFNSRSWQDSHLDHLSTTVAFSGCTYGNAGGLVKSTDLTLYDEFGLLPDQSVGTRSSVCGTFNWGEQTRSDGYHWNIFALDGSTSSAHYINVSSLTTKY